MAHHSDSPPFSSPTALSWPEVTRAISLGLSIALLLFVLMAPQAVRREDALINTAVMPVMLFGIVGGFVHALGYRPRLPILATMVGPWAAWPLMVSSLVFLTLGVSR